MKKRLVTVLNCALPTMSLLVLTTSLAYGMVGSTTNDIETAGNPIKARAADPAIEKALREISPQRIRTIIETLVAFKNRNTLSSMDTDLAANQGATAAAAWLESQFKQFSKESGGRLEVKRDTFTEQPQSRIPKPTSITNIYAVLPGVDPAQSKRMYLVTGHYDTRNSDTMDSHGFAPGANDDSSGVAVSLECARVLSKLKLPATVVFVAVAGEEQGLNGSHHLAQFAKKEGWELAGVLNNDIVGGNTTPGDTLQDDATVRVFSEGIPSTATPEQIHQLESLGALSDSPSREFHRAMWELSPTYFATTHDALRSNVAFHPVLVFRRDRFLRGGDHMSFNQEGFPAVRLTEWREDFNHQHQNVRTDNGVQFGDLIQFVDCNYVANVARLNAATLATLASAPGQPRNVKILTKNLDNATTLNWDAPENAPAHTQYEIVWRETTAPNWEFSTSANAFGDQASATPHAATMPIAKDNVIFGVRSVDAAGHASASVIPFPER